MSLTYKNQSHVLNRVLFEDGNWRLYGHIGDPYSTMGHKCPKWSCERDGAKPVWRWFWGKDNCSYCLEPIPEPLISLWTLHNFDRMASLK